MAMLAQQAVVLVLVVAAAAWVAWSLLLPRAVTARLRRAAGRPADAATGACGGCDRCALRGRDQGQGCG